LGRAKLKILFMLEGVTIPASRFRVLQFLEHFEAAGVEATTWFGYGPEYNRLARTPYGAVYKLGARLRRAAGAPLAATHDVVFVQRPSLPFTAWPEQVVAGLNGRVLFDFDDNLKVDGAGAEVPSRARTFERLVALSARVIAGNAFLADQADAPEKTTVIPTVLDAQRYAPGPSRFAREEGPVIGWMGTSGNFPSVRTILPALERTLAAHPRAIARFVSNARMPELEGHPQVEQIAWRADEEVDQLRAFDVGLMPLEDTVLTRGKCGFKMIQYMSVGVPVVASAVGANVEIFEGSGAGSLVAPGEDWGEALGRAVGRPEGSRREVGEAGRARVLERYSVRGVLPEYLGLFDALAAKG
jgi:glycosyltransferase involved in cell wall biosynthesis